MKPRSSRIPSSPWAALATLLVCAHAQAGGIPIPGFSPDHRVEVESLREARFRGTLAQQFDFSCGAAAVATLLTYHYGRPTLEREAVVAMWETGDRNKIRTLGFSLLDMKSFLAQKGYRAEGYRLSLDALSRAGLPAIALVTIRGYKHFVVIRGLSDQEVLIADPAQGTRAVDRAEFEKIRNPVLLLIRPDSHRPSVFLREWSLKVRAPSRSTESYLNRSRNGPTLLSLPSGNEF
jgi:predicted double-glycine peptidase